MTEGEAAPALEAPVPGSPLATAQADPAPAAPVVPPVVPPVEAAPEAPVEPATPEAPPAPIEIKLPENVQVDEATMASFKTLAQEAGIPADKAQALVDMHLSQLQAQQTSFEEANAKAWQTTVDGWKAEIEADADLSGPKKAANQSAIGKALDTYGSPEARQALDLTGAGWNPAIVKMFTKMALALAEPAPPPNPNPVPAARKTPAEILYPSA